MMTPSSTDIDEMEASNIYPVANNGAASTALSLVELSAIGNFMKHFMLIKSEEEREFRVFMQCKINYKL